NGIKFFSAEGGKLLDSIEMEIESVLEQQMETVDSAKLGKATRIDDASGRYIEFCKSTIPSLTRLSGLKIVVDCANGATYHIAPNVFAELGAQVTVIGNKPDGFNINQDCGSTAPDLLIKKVLATGADLGIGLDGDGDRLILVDAYGQLIDGDQILYIIAKDRHERGLLKGGVVGTVMSNHGLERAITELGISFVRSNVGDRYVLETLRERNWKIGGETSGHIVCLDKTTTGDGIVAALQVLSVMVKQNKSLSELVQGITLLPQSLINLKTSRASDLAKNSQVIQIVKNLEHTLQGEGRVLLRPSGTEPLLRVMVEGSDKIRVNEQAQKLCENIVQIERSLYS
ncbi:MAG: phosphoglucosamine mutase, partial [Legionella sp. 40-6]